MMLFKASVLTAVLIVYLCIPAITAAQGQDIKTKYSRVIYTDIDDLKEFNSSLRIGPLDYLLKHRAKGDDTLSGRVAEKVDIILERVETILEMYPRNFRVDIKIIHNSKEVDKIYRERYSKKVDFISFYFPLERVIYISSEDSSSNILAHELAHAVIDQYYGGITPVKVQEILAQYVDEHLMD